MAKFQIPEHLLPGFKAILNLTKDEVNDLAEISKAIPVGAKPSTFINQLRKQDHIAGVNNIASAFMGLIGILGTETLSEEELAFEIADSYSASLENELSDAELNDLKDKVLTFLLAFTTQKLTFKAHTLLTSNENIYKNAQILSDIRIIFKDNLQENKRNALLIHQLKLNFKTDGVDSSFFVSLDTKDLLKLKSQIERAIEKDHLIKQDYKNIITFLEVE